MLKALVFSFLVINSIENYKYNQYKYTVKNEKGETFIYYTVKKYNLNDTIK